MYAEDELLPISALQHLAFCERRWALIHLERQWEENRFTAEGELLHAKAHSGGVESRPDALIRRTVPLRCFRLGLSGQADVVEFLPCAEGESGVAMPRRAGLWRPYPVEYKRSQSKSGGAPYRIQLCAQALCLEEMLQAPVAAGSLFDGKTRRRVDVVFDNPLRCQTEAMAARLREISSSLRTPPPQYSRRCESCSMNEACLPKAVGRDAARYVRMSVAANLLEDLIS